MSNEHQEDTIPKLAIVKIGAFNEEGNPINWLFDGAGNPNSVGTCMDFKSGISLYGGYTITELKEVYLNEHQEDTKYKQWADGMYVMLDDLDGDYELALVEDSLRDSVYFDYGMYFKLGGHEDCLGVDASCAGLWWSEELSIKLTRAQALYIATGDTNGK